MHKPTLFVHHFKAITYDLKQPLIFILKICRKETTLLLTPN